MTHRTILILLGATCVTVAIFACTGGGDVFSSSTGGAAGSSGSAGSSAGTATSAGSSSSGSVPDPPVVACTEFTDDPDAASDAGADAGSDAGVDAAKAASKCASPPPPVCLGDRAMIEYQEGPCIDETCSFGSTTIGCPGGCFKSLDGGARCNR